VFCTDPWLKRAKKRKERHIKEKKIPKKQKTEVQKKEKHDSNDADSDEFDAIDRECDRALEEARKRTAAASFSEILGFVCNKAVYSYVIFSCLVLTCCIAITLAENVDFTLRSVHDSSSQ